MQKDAQWGECVVLVQACASGLEIYCIVSREVLGRIDSVFQSECISSYCNFLLRFLGLGLRRR